MIVVRPTGGLGNQLFCYAAGLGLAEKLGTTVAVESSRMAGDVRAYRLDQFRIPLENYTPPAQKAPTGPLGRVVERGKNAILRRIDNKRKWFKRKIVLEPHFDFSPDFFKASKDAILEGYWQSYRYFSNVEEKIREQYQFKDLAAPVDPKIAEQLANTTSVGLHVRRGDYVSSYAHHYHLCDPRYYEAAIHEMQRELGSVKVFVFSDDLPWCKSNLGAIPDLTYVSLGSDIREFRHLSLCKHHVISNSTFAWWAAWLGKKPGQRVIAPKSWFKLTKHQLSDLIPESWKVMENVFEGETCSLQNIQAEAGGSNR